MELQGKETLGTNEISAVSASMLERTSPSSGSEDAPVCWICLDGGSGLFYPCKCPRLTHAPCLARWQLQSAGTRKENFCEFCDSQLPDWKRTLTPRCGSNAPAVMNVNFDGRAFSFEVKPGPHGYRLFTEAIRRAFNLPDDSELNITFTCDEPTPLVPPVPTVPDAGSLLTLQGPGAYDAAVHCASVSAARRMTSPPPSRTLSAASEGGAGPHTPRSTLVRTASQPTPSPAPASTSADSDSPAATSASIDSQVALATPKRRLIGGLYRRIKSSASFLGLLLNARQ